jgi:CubicO group peptidase (beta-lactamase class C family)
MKVMKKSSFLLFPAIYLCLFSCNIKTESPADSTLEQKEYEKSRLSRIRDFQEKLIDEGTTGSNIALVYKDGEIIYRNIVNSGKEGDADIIETTIFPIWSMSKPITTVAAMILFEEDGFLLEDPVSMYIPEMKNLKCRDKNGNIYPCRETLTMRHILAHRSGWSYNLAYLDGQPMVITDTLFSDLADFASTIASLPLDHEPGERYTYGINTALVGRVIEVISGQSFYDFLKERIFDPLEMSNTKFYLTEEERSYFQPLYRATPDGAAFVRKVYDELSYEPGSRVQLGGEGLVSTPEDYSHFAEMLVNNGFYKGKRILSPAAIALMHMNHSDEELAQSGFWNGFSYFHLAAPEKDGFLSPKGIFGWSGYHNTHFWIDQENDLFGLFMTRRTPYEQNIQRRFRRAVYQAIY